MADPEDATEDEPPRRSRPTYSKALVTSLEDEIPKFVEDAEALLFGGQREHETLPETRPEQTLLRLRTQAIIEFGGGTTLLGYPSFAAGAELMLRALLENYAHVAWIQRGEPTTNRQRSELRHNPCLGTDHDPRSTPERRALCFELGMASEYARNVTRLIDPRSIGDDKAKAVRARRDELADLHTRSGCPGRGRAYADVKPMLRHLRGSGGVSWAHDVWVRSSAFVHQLLPETFAVPGADFITWGGPLPEDAMWRLLLWLFAVFAETTSLVIRCLNPAQSREMTTLIERYIPAQYREHMTTVRP